MSNLLKDASILLTPTGYDNGRMNAIKPYKDLYGPELVTNGDFSQGTQDWTFNTSGNNQWSVVNEKAVYNASSTDFIITNNVLTIGKKYLVSFDISDTNNSTIRLSVNSEAGGSFDDYTNGDGRYTKYITANTNYLRIGGSASGASFSIDNVSVVEDLSGDFTFSRNSAATRVNAQGLVENVQIISPELVSNGDFSQIGTEEVLNGNFSQEGSELVTNGGFDTDSDWSKGSNWTISGGSANCDGITATSNLSQVITSFSGKTFLVEGNASNVSQGFAYISLGGTDLQIVVNSSGSFKHYVTISSGNSTLFISARNNFIGSIDNVSVKEVGQNWDLAANWSIAENKATSNGTSGNLYQSGIIVTGKQYKIQVTVSDYVSGTVQVSAGAVPRGTMSANGTYTFYQTASSTSNFFVISNIFNGSITNISVKEAGQDWTLGSFTSIGNNVANIVNSTGELSLQQNIGISQKTIKLTYTISNYASGGIRPQYGAVNGLNRSANGTYTEIITGANVSSNLSFFSITANTTATITNISAKEVTDDTDIPRINYSGFSYQDSLGSELVVNGDFATDSNWNKGTGWTISGGTANANTVGNYINLRTNSNIIEPGKTYDVSFDVSNYTQGSVRLSFIQSVATTQVSANGTYTARLVASSVGSSQVYIQGINSFVGSIDNVSVKEYLGQEIVPDSGCGNWLLEPQSTNLINNSELLNTYFSYKIDTTITDNYGTSPSGETNSSRIQFVDDTSFCYNVISVSTDHTSSVFVKGVSGETVRFGIGSSVLTGDLFTFNGLWQRIDFTASSATQIFFSSYGGATTRDFEAFGLQLEALSYATSYIPTNGATNTRLQDIATNSGNSTLINSTEGVLYAEIAALSDDGTSRQISISDSSYNNTLLLRYLDLSNTLQGVFRVGGAFKGSCNFTLSNPIDSIKVAYKYKNSDFALWVNGAEVSTSTDSFSISANTLNELSFDRGDGTQYFYGKNKALAVYKEALTDANLRCLTYPNPVATTFDLDFDTIAEQFTFTRGSEATFVNAQGLIESTASNDAPRIDYSTGAKAFLLEPQSTNLVTYSEDFSQSVWAKGRVSITPNSVKSPDGSINASTLSVTSATGGEEYLRVQTNDSNEATCSFYVKKGNWRYITIRSVNASVFDFDTEAFTFTGTNETVSFEKLQNGWYRLKASSPTRVYCSIGFAVNATTPAGGSGVNGTNMYIWGAQLEQQSYATSYIPTSGATATRNQELCNNATPVINSTEGTLYAEISALANDGTIRRLCLSDGTSSQKVLITFSSTTNRIQFEVINSTNQFYKEYVSSDLLDFHKVAIKYKQNDFSVYVNGSKIHSSTSGNTPVGLSELSFDNGTGSQNFFGNTKGLKYYPKALADVQLEDLTTI